MLIKKIVYHENVMEDLKNADLIPVLYHCLMIFGIAGLVVPLFNPHISPVLGPCMRYYHQPEHARPDFFEMSHVSIMGELGVALLFMMGLELSYEKLAELKRYIFGLGTSQIAFTGLVIAAIAYLLAIYYRPLLLSGWLALSSTAIVMQLIKYGLSRKSVGKVSFSILLMQDMAVVPILVLIGAFAATNVGQSGTPALVIYSLAIATIAVALIYFIGEPDLQPVNN